VECGNIRRERDRKEKELKEAKTRDEAFLR